MNSSKQIVVDAKLSIQRALLGRVTPNLRAVVLSVSDKEIQLRFYFDGSVGDLEIELASEAETEVMADYDSSWSVEAACISADISEQLNDGGVWVYQRNEFAGL